MIPALEGKRFVVSTTFVDAQGPALYEHDEGAKQRSQATDLLHCPV